MASITIDISEQQMAMLQQLAALYGIAPETLLRVSFGDWLNTQKGDFSTAADHVLAKNAELYGRLA